jgi:hypothetical protein
MVAEVLIGLKLVNESCKAIRSLIKLNEATDVSQLGDHIEGLFRGQSQIKKKAHPIASKWGSFMGKTTSDKFLSMAVQETIEEKLCNEQLTRVSRVLNKRFGHETWKFILESREEKMKAHKEAVAEQRRENNRKLNKAIEVLGGIVIVVVMVVGMIIYIKYVRK